MTIDPVRTVNAAAADLANFATDLPVILRRLQGMQAGYPAKASGRGNTATGFDLDDPQPAKRPESDDEPVDFTPVEAAAVRSMTSEDAPALELTMLNTAAANLSKDCTALLKAFARYRTPEELDPRRLGQEPQDWCASCYRHEQHHTPIDVDRRRGTAIYPERYQDTKTGPGGHKAGDPIPHRGLCRWCGRFLTERGYFPPLPVLRARLSNGTGQRVSSALIAKHEPAAKTHRNTGPLASRRFVKGDRS